MASETESETYSHRVNFLCLAIETKAIVYFLCNILYLSQNVNVTVRLLVLG